MGKSDFGNFLCGGELYQHHQTNQDHAEDIGDGTGVDQQQTTGKAYKTQIPGHMVYQVTFQSGSHSEDTYERSDGDGDDFQRGGIHEQHGRVQSEDVRNDEGADSQLGGSQSGLHGICLGNGSTSIGGQRHRRCQVSHDAEVEYEEVGSHSGNAHTDQNGCAGCGHDAVVCGSGNAHAQNDTAQHGQEQGDDHMAACQGNDAVDHHVCQAGHGDGTGDDTGHTAGCGNGDGTLTAGGQSLQQTLGSDAGFTAEEGHENAGHDGQGSGILDAAGAGANQIDQQHQRSQQVGFFQQRLDLGQLFLGQTPQAKLLGFQMDRDEDACKVQNRRQNGLDDDLGVGNLHIVSHQESGSAHDGGHDLTAGGGGCFGCCGKLRLVAGALHQRNGDGAGAYCVGHRGTGDHAFHGGCHDGNLGRTAGETADNGVGDLNEEISNAGTLQEGTEDDEHHDELGADIDGGGEDTFLAVEQIADSVVQLTPQGGVAEAPDQRINDKDRSHDQNGQTHAAAADFCQGQDADDADDDLIPGEVAALLDDIHGENIKVHKCACADDHTCNIIPGHVVGLLVSLSGGENQEAHKDNTGHERGQAMLFQPAGEQGHINAEQGEGGQSAVDGESRLALPDADIGLLVVFFHDGFQVHGFFDGVEVLFLEQCHRLPPGIKKSKWLRRVFRRSRSVRERADYLVSTVTPFSAKYLAAPAWKGAVIPEVAFSMDSSAPLPFSAAMAAVFSKMALVRL